MSMSCKHRWTVALAIDPQPDDIEAAYDVEFHAVAGCDETKAFLDEVMARPDYMGVEIMGTKVTHFLKWMARGSWKRDAEES